MSPYRSNKSIIYLQGANDVITNSDGMTCYEGLNTDYLIAGEGELTTTVPESVQDMLKWKKRDG